MEEYGSTIIPGQDQEKQSLAPVPYLTIITHPDLSRIGERARLLNLERGMTAELSRITPEFHAPGKAFGKPLGDAFMSRKPILMTATAQGGVVVDARQTRTLMETTVNVGPMPWIFSPEQLSKGVGLLVADRITLLLHMALPLSRLPRQDHDLVGFSDGVNFLREEIDKVADLQTPVLLRGASGSGKELVSRAIHQAARPKKPFISVNMGAITPSLAASELFGAVKGSFTGADRNQSGYFRAARGGTLFLDEIGEAPPEVQVMLLRALESGEISPVGSQKPERVETRLIAATDANLEHKMADDAFKTPLFHRLAGYEIRLPALSDRLEDLGRLFMHFARMELHQIDALKILENPRVDQSPWIPVSLAARLLRFSWPGNVRQLRNVVRQLIIGCRGQESLRLVPNVATIFAGDENQAFDGNATNPTEPMVLAEDRRRKPGDVGEAELTATLRQCGWDIKAAAETLNISRGALYLLIEKTPGLRTAAELEAMEIQTALAASENVEDAAERLQVSTRALRRRMNQLGLT